MDIQLDTNEARLLLEALDALQTLPGLNNMTSTLMDIGVNAKNPEEAMRIYQKHKAELDRKKGQAEAKVDDITLVKAKLVQGLRDDAAEATRPNPKTRLEELINQAPEDLTEA